MQDGSGALSFTGDVTPGEERNQRENGISGEKKSLPSRWLSHPVRIANLFGNPFFMASEKVILLVAAQKDGLK